MINLDTDVRFLKGVGEKRAEILYNMGIDTIGALLRFYPRDYKDLSRITPVKDCFFNEKYCVKARIISPVTEHFVRKNMTLYKFTANDGTENIKITIFNNKYLAQSLVTGKEYIFYGKVEFDRFSAVMSSPEISGTADEGIHPVYRASASLSSKSMEKLIKTALKANINTDPLPEKIRKKAGLCGLDFALRNIHFPASYDALETAKKRLVFEELFVLQTALKLIKGGRKKKSAYILKNDSTSEFLSLLPFTLTEAQLGAVNDCIGDMKSGYSMNRLIEGDVGSGKTAVAAALIYNMAKNGIQSALMAPTEILAEQHFASLNSFFEGTEIKCCLLTGSVTKKNKEKIISGLQNGEYHVAIGTHAIISDGVEFKNLGLVITDEQHRFGVAQRDKLSKKGIAPHTLVMSATPIPRTLAFIIYGDLDISIINQYPKGRQKIESYTVDTSYRPRLYNFIKKHIAEGRQAYIVCPAVEEGENLLTSAEGYFKDLKDGEFKDYSVGLLHGKMSAKQKDKVMRDFKDGKINLLVCTTVIEVGIDVPNATVMLIENADRFGLSQLHQLRGRIGRGQHASTCVFISDSKSKTAKERLAVITENSNGFKIAEEDLKLRGPGDFLGERQHGLPEMKIADLSNDIYVLKLSGQLADELLREDYTLKSEENLGLRKEIKDIYKKLR